MGIITSAVEFARTHDGCPGHQFFADGDPSPMSRESRRPGGMDYVEVLRLEGATHEYRDAIDHRVFPARLISRWPDGFAAVEFLRGNVICLDPRSRQQRGGMGCYWPIEPAPPPASPDPMEDDLEPGEAPADAAHEAPDA